MLLFKSGAHSLVIPTPLVYLVQISCNYPALFASQHEVPVMIPYAYRIYYLVAVDMTSTPDAPLMFFLVFA